MAVAPITEPLAVRAPSLRRHFLSLSKLMGEVFTRRFSHMAVVGEGSPAAAGRVPRAAGLDAGQFALVAPHQPGRGWSRSYSNNELSQ